MIDHRSSISDHRSSIIDHVFILRAVRTRASIPSGPCVPPEAVRTRASIPSRPCIHSAQSFFWPDHVFLLTAGPGPYSQQPSGGIHGLVLSGPWPSLYFVRLVMPGPTDTSCQLPGRCCLGQGYSIPGSGVWARVRVDQGYPEDCLG